MRLDGKDPSMRRYATLATLALVLLVVACDQPGATGPVGEQGEVLLTFERTGGIAGFSDRVVVGYGGEYYMTRKGEESIGTLARDARKQLDAWTLEHAAFSLTLEENPGGADSMKRRLVWRGRGRTIPGEREQRELLDWAEGLLGMTHSGQ
jgi:hypothetical protein